MPNDDPLLEQSIGSILEPVLKAAKQVLAAFLRCTPDQVDVAIVMQSAQFPDGRIFSDLTPAEVCHLAIAAEKRQHEDLTRHETE